MNGYLTNLQIALFIFNAMFGFGIMILPQQVATWAVSAGWFVILFFAIISIIITYMITYLNYTFKEKTLDEYSKILVGKFFSKVIIIFYIIYLFLYTSTITRRTSEMVKASMLANTPTWVLCLSLLFVCYFAINRGLNTIARVCELYGPFIIIIMLLLYTLFFTQGDFINLKPFLGYENLLYYLKSSYPVMNSFLGMELIGVIPFNSKNDKKVFKYSVLSTLLTGLLYIFLYEATISLVGYDRIIFYEDALIAAARRTEVPYLEFLRRIDGIVITVWLVSVITTVTIMSYSLVFYLSKIFKKVNINIVTTLSGVATFLGCHLPRNTKQIHGIADIAGYAGIFCSVFITIILFIVLKVKQHEEKNH